MRFGSVNRSNCIACLSPIVVLWIGVYKPLETRLDKRATSSQPCLIQSTRELQWPGVKIYRVKWTGGGEGVWPPNFHAVFTPRKRSLGQGNLFTPVCDSVHRGVSGRHPLPGQTSLQGRHPPIGRHPLPEMATAADGTHPAGMHSCTCLEENLVDTTAFHSDAYYPLENRTYFSFSCHH